MTEAFPGGITSPQEWLDGIMPRAPNVPIDFVKFTVLQKAREFFAKSGAWRDWVGPILLHPEQALYSVELSDVKAELDTVLDVLREYDGIHLNVRLPEDQYKTLEPGEPAYFHQKPEQGVIQIWPPPATEDPIKNLVFVFCTMKPMDLCMPNWIRQRHYDAICDGVLSVIHMTKGSVNYDIQLGARLERRFKSATSAAAQASIAAWTGVGERVATPPFVMGSQRLRMNRTTAVAGTRW